MRRPLMVTLIVLAFFSGLFPSSAFARPNPEPGGHAPRDSEKSPPRLTCDVTGTRGDDTLTSARNRVVCGRGGNDQITAGFGNVVYGGRGADKIISLGGSAVYGDEGTDRFCTSNRVPDLLYGGAGRDARNIDGKYDATKSIERRLRDGACPEIQPPRAPSKQGPVETPSDDVQGVVDPTPVTGRLPITGRAAREYWATQDLSQYKAIPMPAAKEPSPSNMPALPADSARPRATEPRAPLGSGIDGEQDPYPIYNQGWQNRPFVGRLYVAGDGYCSATLVAVDIVLTAAHCIYGRGGFTHQQGTVAFGPNAWGGDAAGLWEAESYAVHQYWIDSGATFYPYDYGFYRLQRGDDGTLPGDVVGWAGIVPNYVSDMWSFGYPETGTFFQQWGGAYPYYCYSPYSNYSTWTSGGSNYFDIAIGCTMTGGASGGPWFTSYNGNWNYVASVNSHCWHPDFFCKDYWSANLWGPYFTQATIDLFHSV